MDPLIPRKVFTPVFALLAAVTILTAAISHLCLWDEFQTAMWIVDSHPPLPKPTALLHSAYPFIWLLPFGTITVGLWLCRQSQLSARRLAVFVSAVSFALFAWGALIAVSFFGVYSQRGHYIMPLNSP